MVERKRKAKYIMLSSTLLLLWLLQLPLWPQQQPRQHQSRMKRQTRQTWILLRLPYQLRCSVLRLPKQCELSVTTLLLWLAQLRMSIQFHMIVSLLLLLQLPQVTLFTLIVKHLFTIITESMFHIAITSILLKLEIVESLVKYN